MKQFRKPGKKYVRQGEGLKRDEMTQFLRSAGEMLVAGLDDEHPSLAGQEETLLSILRDSAT